MFDEVQNTHTRCRQRTKMPTNLLGRCTRSNLIGRHRYSVWIQYCRTCFNFFSRFCELQINKQRITHHPPVGRGKNASFLSYNFCLCIKKDRVTASSRMNLRYTGSILCGCRVTGWWCTPPQQPPKQ